MNGRAHDDIERLAREVQQFESFEGRGLVQLILVAWVLVCAAGYCLYRAYEAWPS